MFLFCYSTVIREARGVCFIVIQCDAALTNGELIACGRHRVYDSVQEVKHAMGNKCKVFVLIVIHTPRSLPNSSSFIGFQTNPWVSYHIDTLFPSTREASIDLSQAGNCLIHNCFENCTERVHSILPAAACKVIDATDCERGTARIRILLGLTEQREEGSKNKCYSSLPFYHLLLKVESFYTSHIVVKVLHYVTPACL